MNSFPSPGVDIEKYIKDLLQEFSFELKSKRYIPQEELDELLKRRNVGEWIWILKKPHSLVEIQVSFYNPSCLLSVSFANRDERLKGKVSTYFPFEKYLSKHLKSTEDVARIHKVIAEQSWKDNWHVELDILKEHLRTDLLNIVDGREWPDIPFYMEDYVEPAAMDRIYQDQLTRIEEKTREKNKGWLYFLNFSRKKK